MIIKGTTGLAVTLLSLYAAQSITSSMVQTALPVVLREAGVSLDRIGFLSLLFLPWVLKMIWAPLVDRFGSPRIWVLACQVALCLCFVLSAPFSPVDDLPRLVPLIFVMAIIAATQDIATDAAGVHATNAGTRVIASGASTIGGYLGYLVGGGIWLWAYAAWGWQSSMLTLALTLLVLTVPVAALRLPPVGPRPDASVWRSLRNRRLIAGAGFLVLWQGGVRLGLAMTGPMLVDAGLDLQQIAWLRGAGGMGVGLSAAILGTLAVHRFGKNAVLRLAGGALILSLAGLCWWSLRPGSVWMLAGLQIALLSGIAISFVALYAQMMDWCAPEQAATDFALLQGLDIALAVATGVLAGQIAERWGYAPVFVISALLLCLGLLRMRKRIPCADAPEFPINQNA